MGKLMVPTRKELQRQIGLLRFLKALSILNAQCKEEKIEVFFQNRLIDLLLLPLYYAWEKFGIGTLKELRIENHLKDIYASFVQHIRQLLPDYIQATKSGQLPLLTGRREELQKSLLKTYINIKNSL